MKRARISHWRIWVMLTNEEKVKLYPKLKDNEKRRIWTDEYMKVIKLNMYPNKYKDKYDARFAELNTKGERNE
tara:strand:- start:1666 stop:1884 length:219 start_codon:yes stop_codon:yes gene_type:complete